MSGLREGSDPRIPVLTAYRNLQPAGSPTDRSTRAPARR